MIIRDAIHGSIELSPVEAAALDSPLVQRLRYVKQLSTAYLVFPSAQHTRLEHSLGAMHLSGRLCGNLGIDEPEKELLRLAALLHDVGHGAFAHDIEPLMRKYTGRNHEERGIALLRGSSVADAIGAAGFSLSALQGRMNGERGGSMLVSDLGTDRIDYLLRDAYFTGVAYSLIDADRLLRTLVLKDGELVVTEKGRLAAESLLVSRYFMFNVVYYHPTARIAGAMVVKAAEGAIESGVLSAEDVMAQTDEGLLMRLHDEGSALAGRVLGRRLYKKAAVVDTSQNASAKEFFSRAGAAGELDSVLSAAGLSCEDYVACLPVSQSRKLGARLLRGDGGLEDITANSGLMRALEGERRESHFVLGVCEEKRVDAARAVGRLLNL